jgi:hypothetical protein
VCSKKRKLLFRLLVCDDHCGHYAEEPPESKSAEPDSDSEEPPEEEPPEEEPLDSSSGETCLDVVSSLPELSE